MLVPNFLARDGAAIKTSALVDLSALKSGHFRLLDQPPGVQASSLFLPQSMHAALKRDRMNQGLLKVRTIMGGVAAHYFQPPKVSIFCHQQEFDETSTQR